MFRSSHCRADGGSKRKGYKEVSGSIKFETKNSDILRIFEIKKIPLPLTIEISKGNLICFMDDDDFSDNKRVTLQVKEFLSNGFPKKKYMACCTGVRKEYPNGYFKDF